MCDAYDYYSTSYELNNTPDEKMDKVREMLGVNRTIAERKKIREDELQQELDALIINQEEVIF